VVAAVDSGDLAERRLASWHKLQREVSWMARRQDARLRSQERDRWKRIHMEVRRSGRSRP
jgi:ribosome biogenesis GTPase